MLEVDFAGPYALIPNSDAVPYLLGAKDAWAPGVYLWTFLYNQAHRVNYVGYTDGKVAARNNDHLSDFLKGARTIYHADGLAQGEVMPRYTAQDSHDEFIAAVPQLMQHLAALRIFYAPYDGPETMGERIATSIIAHYHRLGGKAVAWLENAPIDYDAGAYAEQFTMRIGRPAFIASLPDEMHI